MAFAKATINRTIDILALGASNSSDRGTKKRLKTVVTVEVKPRATPIEEAATTPPCLVKICREASDMLENMTFWDAVVNFLIFQLRRYPFAVGRSIK